MVPGIHAQRVIQVAPYCVLAVCLCVVLCCVVLCCVVLRSDLYTHTVENAEGQCVFVVWLSTHYISIDLLYVCVCVCRLLTGVLFHALVVVELAVLSSATQRKRKHNLAVVSN